MLINIGYGVIYPIFVQSYHCLIKEHVLSDWLDVLEIGPECHERFVECTKVPELETLDIHLCGISHLSGKYCVGRVDPIAHTIFYPVDGAIELYTEAGHQTVDKCHLVTLPAHKPFLIELKSPNFSMVWFDLVDTAKWRDLCIHRPAVAVCDSGRQLFHVLGLMYYERSEVLRKPSMKQLAYYLEETLCAPLPGASESQRLDQLIRDIEKKLHFQWTVADMGKIIQYSAPHLHRLFQKRFGRSPIQHLIFLRMQRAKYLLVYTTWSIEQIAEQLGYNDVFNFSKRFKKSIGFPPGQYRKKEKEKGLFIPAVNK